ncbi:MAG: sigma-54-dependent transcriptional regulator [Ignavibacteriaceae bacterium]
MKFHILIFDDQDSLPASLVKTISRFSYETSKCSEKGKLYSYIEKNNPDILLTDITNEAADKVEMLRKIQLHFAGMTSIIILDYADLANASRILRFGRVEFILRPADSDYLQRILKKNFEIIKEKLENIRYSEILKLDDHFLEFFKRDRSNSKLLTLIERVAKNENNSLLIRGETGSGKEIAAKYVHLESSRRERPFIYLNCAANSRFSLAEELFGSENEKNKAGVVKIKYGKIELADSGSLLLDHIDRLPLSVQGKLIKYIKTRKFHREGGEQEIRSDVRIIGSTRLDLEQMVEDGEFRDDLFAEINSAAITVPPLRHRREYIPYLVHLFSEEFSQKYGKEIHKIDPSVIVFFKKREWKGNIGELKNAMERGILLMEGDELSTDNFSFLEFESQTDNTEPEELLLRIPKSGIEINTVLKEVIIRTLEITNGNQVKASKILGLTRSRLLYRMEKLGIPHNKKNRTKG